MYGLTYALKHIVRRKWDSLMKVISLASGIIVGMVLIARIAFDLSYDCWIPDAGCLYRIQSLFTTQTGTDQAETSDYGNTVQPVAPTAAIEIPGVEAGTSIWKAGGRVVFHSSGRYETEAIYADTSLFSTIGLEILEGDESGLGIQDNAFLSESLAKAIFGDTGPYCGRTVFTDKAMQKAKTVAGVFRDIPENSHLDFNLVLSPTGEIPWDYCWDSRDGFTGYIRLSPEADPDEVNKALPEMMHRHMDMKLQSDMGYSFSGYIKPVTGLHTSESETRQSIIIMGIFVILLLAAVSLNYVLMSVSSLDSRARNTAVSKCMGASSGSIFRSILWETAILVATVVILGILVLYTGKDMIEYLTGMPFKAMFSTWQITGYAAACLAVIAIAGLVPARIFSSVPAMDVFRKDAREHAAWKRLLMFSQILCSAFIAGFMFMAVSQYRFISGKNMGYDPDRLAYCRLDSISHSDRQMLKDELLRNPWIEKVTFSENIPVRKFNGMQLIDPDTGESVSTCRYTFADTDFISTSGIRIIEGSDIPGEISDPAPALVNRSFVRMLGWEESPIGKSLPDNGMTICGVFDDFIVQSVLTDQDPVCLLPLPEAFTDVFITLRLKDMSPEILSNTENLLRKLSPGNDIVLSTYRADIHASYRDTERFRNSVSFAAAFMLVITLTGLLGYISDEMRRKRKETAVRKVNGATVSDIERTVLKDIGAVSVPAVLGGLVLAYIATGVWLQNFPERTGTGIPGFAATGAVLLFIILSFAAARALAAARENPTKYLRGE